MTTTTTTATIDRSNEQAERKAHAYAVADQGFRGSYADWQAISDEERVRYEQGAAGLPTA